MDPDSPQPGIAAMAALSAATRNGPKSDKRYLSGKIRMSICVFVRESMRVNVLSVTILDHY